MTKEQLQKIIQESYEDYIKKAFTVAVENSLIDDPNAISRFAYALKKCTEVRDEILKRAE